MVRTGCPPQYSNHTNKNWGEIQMSKKKSWLKVIGIIILVLLVAAVVMLLCLDTILKGSIEKIGSTVTKSDISIEKINLSLLKGELLLENFKVGNPEGYKTDEAFSLTKVFVSLKPSSLMSDTIQITEVQIIDPSLTFEAGLGNTNLGTILENVNRFVPSGDPNKPKEKPEGDKPGKKVQIDHVVVNGGKVRLSAKILGGAALPIPLPGVELKDIGKEKENEVGMVEASAMILKEMLTGAISAVGSGATAVMEGGKEALESTGKAAAETGKAALESGKKLGKGLMNVLGGGKEKEPAPAQ